MDKDELKKREEAAKIIQYEWRYYIFFNYDVCGECGYGGKDLECACSNWIHDKLYQKYFDITDEV